MEGNYHLIFRGQGDANWKLIPSLFRDMKDRPLKFLDIEMSVGQIIIEEFLMLHFFISSCDRIGINIPNDSTRLRNIIEDKEKDLEKYTKNPLLWPAEEVLNTLAMAQHHNIPTRLLDWSKLPSVAMYFAASSALNKYKSWGAGDKLAIWILDTAHAITKKNVLIHRPPGAVSLHLAAQYGLFTIHPNKGKPAAVFKPFGLEDYFVSVGETPLTKVTIPIFESIDLLGYCNNAGFSAADLFPTADGAGLGVMNTFNIFRAKRYLSLK